MVLNDFVLYDFLWTKCHFGILYNLYVGQKVVLWFSEGQEFHFLSCLLPPVCHVLKIAFTNQIRVVMSFIF